jgi:hypothetical protein
MKRIIVMKMLRSDGKDFSGAGCAKRSKESLTSTGIQRA